MQNTLIARIQSQKYLIQKKKVLNGDINDKLTIQKAKQEDKLINKIMLEEGIHGFSSVTVAKNWCEGASYILQLTGLGGMIPNTVMLGWPSNNNVTTKSQAHDYVKVLRLSLNTGKAILAIKGLKIMPLRDQVMTGTMDVWWMIHDGGL